MNVRKISVTSATIDGRVLTAEELIVYTARVSNPDNQMNFETSDRLIAYLIKNKHWSPFEMVDMTIEIKTSRAIAAQILRHRSFSFQEFSQRYSEVTAVEPIEIRQSATSNRQSSLKVFDPYITASSEYASRLIDEHLVSSLSLYDKLIDSGVAKECARMILPLTVQTTLFMKGSLRSWIHYLQIRLDEHTQKEHREIAAAILDIFTEEFPTIAKGNRLGL